MSVLKKSFLGIVSLLVAQGCTSSFEDLNKNPNLVEHISPATLLNPIIYEVASHNVYRGGWQITDYLMQVNLPFPSVYGGVHRYEITDNLGASTWNAYYKWAANIREMELAADAYKDVNYKAISLTLKTLVYAELTDVFGDIPMSEASKGDQGILRPKFDTQEEIYTQLLANLEQANTLYDTSSSMVYSPDILFGNDIKLWKKFTNSLHLRLLLRISNRVETQAFAKMTFMLNNPNLYPVFTSTEEAAVLQVTGVNPNISPWSRTQDFRLNRKMSTFFLNNLNNFEDPRRDVFATKATNSDNMDIGYVGIPSAYDGSESQFNYNASTLEISMVENPMILPILTFSEVCFIKAELAQRGYIDNAQHYYEEGVKAAMELWGVNIPETYFDNPYTAYDGSLERIMLQKYYALYFNGYQQWFEYRRTGFPELPTTTSMLNDGVMPSRLYYPLDIRVQNSTNYEEVVKRIGGDDINTKVWWDIVD